MNEDLVKYGKYGAIALVSGLVAYILFLKYKNPAEEVKSNVAEIKAASAEIKAASDTLTKINSSNEWRLINSTRTNETGFGRTNLSYTPTEISPTRNAISRT
jgi:hypothetical protein